MSLTLTTVILEYSPILDTIRISEQMNGQSELASQSQGLISDCCQVFPRVLKAD
jgi:hypothetical protein